MEIEREKRGKSRWFSGQESLESRPNRSEERTEPSGNEASKKIVESSGPVGSIYDRVHACHFPQPHDEISSSLWSQFGSKTIRGLRKTGQV